MSRNPSPSIVFDEDAALYDAVRPAYPEAVVEAIAAVLPDDGTILEIGTGTGKATCLIAPKGYRIHCLEPGANLAEVARKNLLPYPEVTLEATTFEEWSLQESAFDLILSATAFHWVEPEVRYIKSAQALKKGGHLALLWNLHLDPATGISQKIQEVYEHCRPDTTSSPRPTLEVSIQRWVEEIQESSLYEDCDVLQFPWSEWYTTDQYLRLLETYSDHRPLPEPIKRCLYGGISDILNKNGGGWQKEYVAVLYLARKRGH